MLRAIFGIDPKLSNKINITMKSFDDNFLATIKFDVGIEHKITSTIIHSVVIPDDATKVTITSSNNINSYGFSGGNAAITSIEEFTSDSVIDYNFMFTNFINLKEVKNINLNWDKITSANYMCTNWKSFNSILPDDFCSNMSSLKDASHMFSGWKSFNQELPKDFCSNMISLENADNMFEHWISYKYEIPDSLYEISKKSYNKNMTFFSWYNHENTPSYNNILSLHDYKNKDIDELDYLLTKYKDNLDDFRILSKLYDKEYVITLKGNIDHNIIISNGELNTFPSLNKNEYINLRALDERFKTEPKIILG